MVDEGGKMVMKYEVTAAPKLEVEQPPETEAPSTETPSTEAPSTEETDKPSTEAPPTSSAEESTGETGSASQPSQPPSTGSGGSSGGHEDVYKRQPQNDGTGRRILYRICGERYECARKNSTGSGLSGRW